MKIPRYIYRCNRCNYDEGLVFAERRDVYGFTFHRINSMHPDEMPYSVLKVENKNAEYHICSECLDKLQEKDNEIGLNRALNRSQVEQLIGEQIRSENTTAYIPNIFKKD